MPFTHSFRVRYNECDPQGIVFNANYVMYVDLAVTELWRELFGSYEGFVTQTGTDVVVADLQLRFRAAARFDEEITVTLDPQLTSEASITSALTVARDGQTLVEGTIRHVCVDAVTLHKTAAPVALRAALDRQP